MSVLLNICRVTREYVFYVLQGLFSARLWYSNFSFDSASETLCDLSVKSEVIWSKFISLAIYWEESTTTKVAPGIVICGNALPRDHILPVYHIDCLSPPCFK